MTEPQQKPSPRFEIVREKDMPRRRARPFIGGFLGAIRTVIEDAYVALAQQAMVGVEQMEDARAARGHAARTRKAERQRLRRGQGADALSVKPRATASTKPAA